MAGKFTSVDEYIGSFPEEVQAVLEEVRHTIRGAVHGAGEKISYQIPAVTLDAKVLMYYSGWKKHISVYPIPDVDEALERDIAPYKSGKGTLKFPLGQPIPYDLIARVATRFVEQRHAETAGTA